MAGVLPFLTTGVLLEQGGAPVVGAEAIPCSVWPASSSTNRDTARTHDHSGEASLAHAEALAHPNRVLVVDGVRYRIVAATPAPFMGHVVLELLRVSNRS